MAAVTSKSAAIRAKLGPPDHRLRRPPHRGNPRPARLHPRRGRRESVLQRVKKNADFQHWTQLSADERSDARTTAITWWLAPTKNGLDRATAMIPRLLAERLDDLGLDFCALYPSGGLGYPRLPDEELRRVCCRAYNKYVADTYGPYSSRMTPAALIPLHNPEEGIEEMEFAVRELGLKVAMIAGHVRRPIGKVRREHPGAVAELRLVVRRLRRGQRARLRPLLGQVHRAWHAAGHAHRRLRLHQQFQHQQLHAEPPRPLRQRRQPALQVALLQRRHPPPPQAPHGLPGVRRGMGRRPLRRHHRPLGETKPRGAAKRRPPAPRRGSHHGCSSPPTATKRRWASSKRSRSRCASPSMFATHHARTSSTTSP